MNSGSSRVDAGDKLILLENGSIYTMDPHHTRASSLLIRNGRIAAVDKDSLRSHVPPGTQIVDLAGHCVIPGLVDSHVHLTSFGLALQQVDLGGAKSLEDAMDRVANRAKTTPPGQWIKGRGWDQERWTENRFPSAADLDQVSRQHPITLTAKSGHASVVNSLALQKAGIDAATEDPPGGRIERDTAGNPTGLLLEEAMKLAEVAIPIPAPETMASALSEAFEYAWKVGLTSVHDMGMSYTSDGVAFKVLQDLHIEEKLGLRVTKYIQKEFLDQALELGLCTGLGDTWLRVGGIKLYMDGALGMRTAAMLDPYIGYPDNLGIVIIEQHELDNLVHRAAAGGLALVIHALGDRANRTVLNVLENVSDAKPPLRHRIEHVQVLHPQDVSRLAALDIVASMQPTHAVQDAPMADRYWGSRCATAYAWRSLLDAGTVLAFGSDCPIEKLDPFAGIHAAVTRLCPDGYAGDEGWYPEQRLTVAETVRAFTWGAAYAVGLENSLGSLEVGKLADLTVLDRNLFTVPAETLADTKAVGTMIEGEFKLPLQF